MARRNSKISTFALATFAPFFFSLRYTCEKSLNSKFLLEVSEVDDHESDANLKGWSRLNPKQNLGLSRLWHLNPEVLFNDYFFTNFCRPICLPRPRICRPCHAKKKADRNNNNRSHEGDGT